MFLQTLFLSHQICRNIEPNLPFKRIKSWSVSAECTTWYISTPHLRERDHISAPGCVHLSNLHLISTWTKKKTKKTTTLHPSPSPPRPPHPFLEIFSGRNCAVLKQIYFNTRHNIWTNEKKKLEHFYILLSRSKKKKRNWTLGFFIVCQFCILTSSLQRSMCYFCHEGATLRRRGEV